MGDYSYRRSSSTARGVARDAPRVSSASHERGSCLSRQHIDLFRVRGTAAERLSDSFSNGRERYRDASHHPQTEPWMFVSKLPEVHNVSRLLLATMIAATPATHWIARSPPVEAFADPYRAAAKDLYAIERQSLGRHLGLKSGDGNLSVSSES